MMKTIVHEYKGKKSDWYEKKFIVKDSDLQEIVLYLIKKYTNKVKITKEITKSDGKQEIDITETEEKLVIPVSEIDDMVEEYYPGIGEIPEGPDNTLREYTNFKNANKNVWLDASYEVQEELKRFGFETRY